VVVEGVAVLLLKAALEVEEVVGQEMQLVEEVAEEERYHQEVAAQVLLHWVAKEVVQAGQRFHEEAEVVAFLQLQRSQLGRKNPLEVVEVGHLNEQAAVVGLTERVCPRKEAAR
jgi:rubrerythrin